MAMKLCVFMLMVRVLITFTCTWWTAAAATDETCDADGTCKVKDPTPHVAQEKIVAGFKNLADVDVTVFWIDDGNGKEILVTTVPAGHTQHITTSMGHRFAMKGKGLETNFVVVRTKLPEFTMGSMVRTNQPEFAMGPEHGVVFNVELPGKGGFPVKIRNKCGGSFQMWWQPTSGAVGTQMGVIHAGQQEETTTYHGHVFCFSNVGDHRGCQKANFKLTMNQSQSTYVLYDGTGDADITTKWDAEEVFNKGYKARTGRDWVAFWPRKPPTQHMHPAEQVGDTIKIHTSVPPRHKGANAGADSNMLTLRVLSLEPRAFLVRDFLTKAEANHLVKLGSGRITRSQTGSGESALDSDTRTSRNTWIAPRETDITWRLYRRAAELANVPVQIGFENMQLVHYGVGQEYQAHYDWQMGDDGPTRYITLLLYLNEPAGGGATSFPQANPPMKVHPGMGGAVMFYNLLPDGNGDSRSLHSGMPVTEGEKWLANFWIWDPPKAR